MVTLDELLDRADDDRDRTRDTLQRTGEVAAAGLARLGWLCAKLLLLVVWTVAAPLFAAGYITSRIIVPAGKWCAAAYMTGFEAGIRRGPA